MRSRINEAIFSILSHVLSAEVFMKEKTFPEPQPGPPSVFTIKCFVAQNVSDFCTCQCPYFHKLFKSSGPISVLHLRLFSDCVGQDDWGDNLKACGRGYSGE